MSYVPQKQLRSAVTLFTCLFLAAVMVLVASLAGCAARVAHVTDLPPGVTEAQAKNWDAAVGDLHRIADLNSALRQTVISLRTNGAFTRDAEYTTALTSIGRIAQYEIEAAHFLEAQPKTFGAAQQQKLKSEIALISGELNTLNSIGATGIKNAESQKTVAQIIGEIIGTTNLILALL